jgi:hypothetical protein
MNMCMWEALKITIKLHGIVTLSLLFKYIVWLKKEYFEVLVNEYQEKITSQKVIHSHFFSIFVQWCFLVCEWCVEIVDFVPVWHMPSLWNETVRRNHINKCLKFKNILIQNETDGKRGGGGGKLDFHAHCSKLENCVYYHYCASYHRTFL